MKSIYLVLCVVMVLLVGCATPPHLMMPRVVEKVDRPAHWEDSTTQFGAMFPRPVLIPAQLFLTVEGLNDKFELERYTLYVDRAEYNRAKVGELLPAR